MVLTKIYLYTSRIYLLKVIELQNYVEEYKSIKGLNMKLNLFIRLSSKFIICLKVFLNFKLL